MIMTEEEKTMTAYHEAGHAIVGLEVLDGSPLHKVTIIPRGQALGVTFFLEDDRHSHSKQHYEGMIAKAYGGRIAEELIYGPAKVTDGASQDIKMATSVARQMVTKLGMSDTLGPLSYGEDEQEVFLGHSVTQHKNISDATARLIDEEVRVIVDRAYGQAKNILVEKLDRLHAMAAALIKFETIDADQVGDIMAGKSPRVPKDWTGDAQPPKSGGGEVPVASADEDDSKPAGGPIGGPAGEH